MSQLFPIWLVQNYVNCLFPFRRSPRNARYPNWKSSEAELRELRKQVTFALVAEEGDMAKVASTVDALFMLLRKSACV